MSGANGQPHSVSRQNYIGPSEKSHPFVRFLFQFMLGYVPNRRAALRPAPAQAAPVAVRPDFSAGGYSGRRNGIPGYRVHGLNCMFLFLGVRAQRRFRHTGDGTAEWRIVF